MKGKRSESEKWKSLAWPITLAILLILTMTKLSLAEELKIGVGIANIQINQSQRVQLNLPTVNRITNVSPNITMNIPVSYFETGLQNITIKKTSFGFKNPQNIKINESGVIKNATVSGDYITLEANLSTGSAVLVFDLFPPTLSQENTTIINATTIHKNFTIISEESFTNVSVTLRANESYGYWTLWHYEGNGFVDRTGIFNLNVSGGVATFYNFSSSIQLFKLEGTTACHESWSCTAWGDAANSCGTRTCTDSNSCGTTNSKPSESANCPSASGGGGGGGGGRGAAPTTVKAFYDFEISENLIREELLGDGIIKKVVTIKNTGTKPLELKIDFSGVKDFVITPRGVSKLEMTLAPGEESSFDIILFGSGLKKAGVYSGNIVVNGEGIEKRVTLVLDYESGEPLFDVEVNMLKTYSMVYPGDSVYAEMRLFNLKGIGKVDVRMNYSAKDSEGRVVASGHTTVAVETQASFVKNLRIPRTAKPGTYVFVVEAEYHGAIGVGSDTFEVVLLPETEKASFGMPKASLLALIALLGIIALFFAYLIKHTRHKPEDEGKAIFKKAKRGQRGMNNKTL